MRVRSLVPSNERNDVARPAALLFGPLHREIDRLFSEFSQGPGALQRSSVNLIPNIDVSETDKEIDISVEMPGLKRSDIEISLEDNVLTIRGEKRIEANRNDKNVFVNERAYGVFLRTIELPPGIDSANIAATMSNGVLRVTIPKPANSETKKIAVKEGNESDASTSTNTH
jgi:HSP20 family protein